MGGRDSAYLQLVSPGQVSIVISLGASVDVGSRLPLLRRRRIFLVIGRWPLPFVHLQGIRGEEGNSVKLDGGHQGHEPKGRTCWGLRGVERCR